MCVFVYVNVRVCACVRACVCVYVCVCVCFGWWSIFFSQQKETQLSVGERSIMTTEPVRETCLVKQSALIDHQQIRLPVAALLVSSFRF